LPQSILVDTGGTLVDGSGEGPKRNQLLVRAMSEMGYDVLNVGGSEVLAGPTALEQLAVLPRPQLVGGPAAAHPGTTEGENPTSKPYLVLERSGLRIGFVGVRSPDTSAGSSGDGSLASLADAVRPMLSEVKGQADVIVVLADLDLSEVQALAGAGLDPQVVLGGRSAAPRPATREGSTIVASAGAAGENVGTLTLQVLDGGQVVAFRGETTPLDGSITADAEMTRLRDQYR
jgi:2',3'-cyclic-nucleotide 2'-phosphodiesterase (5'-nucleotidase family)